MFINKWRAGFIEMFEKVVQVPAAIDNIFMCVLNNQGVKSLAVFLPLLRSTDNARSLFRRNRATLFVLRRRLLDCRTPFEFAHGIESSGKQVGPRHDG